jgi:hypothetical protein
MGRYSQLHYPCVQCGCRSKKGRYEPRESSLEEINKWFRYMSLSTIWPDEYALTAEALRDAPRCLKCLRDYVDRRRLGYMVEATPTQEAISTCHLYYEMYVGRDKAFEAHVRRFVNPGNEYTVGGKWQPRTGWTSLMEWVFASPAEFVSVVSTYPGFGRRNPDLVLWNRAPSEPPLVEKEDAEEAATPLWVEK